MIVDTLRRAVTRTRRYFQAGYDAGSSVITRLSSWLPSNLDVNSLIVGDGELMRARSRKLIRENPYAAGALKSFVANAVGTGITPRSAHPDAAWRERINKAFLRWSKQADATGLLDFYGLQSLAVRSLRADGEVFTRLRFRRAQDGLFVPLQLQLLEADFVPYTKVDDQAAFYTRAGIQFNLVGKREGYWMYRDHPGSGWVRDSGLYFVGADQVLHSYEVERAGQIRGAPWLTPAIVMLYDIKQLMDAMLMRQKITNLLGVFIKREGPAPASVLGESATAEDGVAISRLKVGGVHYLNPGEEPEFMNTMEPGIGGKEFIVSMLRAVARAIGITYEQLTGDLSGVNYSSIRAGMLEFRRWCEAFQFQTIVHQWCDPIWKAWIEQAVLSGALGEDARAGFADDPDAFTAVRWDTPGWPWVDPVKDVQAAIAGVRAGFTSRERVVAETGESVEDIDREQTRDNARADELELAYDSDGRRAAAGAAVTAEPTDDTAPAEDKTKEAATK